jgi:hypothetical protein
MLRSLADARQMFDRELGTLGDWPDPEQPRQVKAPF